MPISGSPFFHQTTNLHINEWSFNDFDKFEEFIKKNKDMIISYEEMLAKTTDNLIIKLLNKLTKILLISYRKFFLKALCVAIDKF